MISSYIHRTRTIQNCPSKSHSTQAPRKSISSPRECISSINAPQSSLVKQAMHTVRDGVGAKEELSLGVFVWSSLI